MINVAVVGAGNISPSHMRGYLAFPNRCRIVEKPMALSLTECDAMIVAARESRALLSVVAQNRFRDEVVILKGVVDSGLLGPVAHLSIDSAWWRGLPYYDLSWRGTWESEGGGPTLNHAIHH